MTEAATLDRIRSLVLPPAWRDVWICPDERGHIQATGVDAKGRRQYRYHDEWRAPRDPGPLGLARFAGPGAGTLSEQRAAWQNRVTRATAAQRSAARLDLAAPA